MKTLTTAALAVASITVAQAVETNTTIVQTDFTSYSSAETPITSISTDPLDGWKAAARTGDNTPYYTLNANGAVNTNSWKQNTLIYSLTGTTITSDATKYVITYTTYAAVEDNQNAFFLSSSSYSILIGNSYTSNNSVYVGSDNSDIASASALYTFQSGTDGRVVVSPITGSTGASSSGTTINVGTSLTYTLVLSSGSLELSVTDGNGSNYTNTFTIADDFNFDAIGFINDASEAYAGVTNIAVVETKEASSVVPEPATATLSLLALAGLAARRRRK